MEVKIEGKKLELSGPLGKVWRKFEGNDCIWLEDGILIGSKNSYGTFKGLWENMCKGTTEGYYKELLLVGRGYKFTNLGESLIFKVGYSHYIRYNIPESVRVIGWRNRLFIFGVDKEEVNRIAASIRALRKAEPYKGKGIRYVDEVVKLKVGKKR